MPMYLTAVLHGMPLQVIAGAAGHGTLLMIGITTVTGLALERHGAVEVVGTARTLSNVALMVFLFLRGRFHVSNSQMYIQCTSE